MAGCAQDFLLSSSAQLHHLASPLPPTPTGLASLALATRHYRAMPPTPLPPAALRNKGVSTLLNYTGRSGGWHGTIHSTHPPLNLPPHATVARRRPGHPQELSAVAYGCPGRQPVPHLHPRTGRFDTEARPRPLLKFYQSHPSSPPFSPHSVCGEPRLCGQRGGQVPPTTGQGLRVDAQELGPAKGTMGREED